MHVEVCSTSLITSKMQIQTTAGYHLAVDREAMVKIYKQEMLERMGRKETPPVLLGAGDMN